MERAGDLIALDLAVRKIAAHVPAVGIKNVDRPVSTAKDDQLASERGDGVRFSVTEFPGQAQTMPARAKRVGAACASIWRTSPTQSGSNVVISAILAVHRLQEPLLL